MIPHDGKQITWRISAYAVISKGSKVLLKQECDRARFDFPGGGIDPQESLIEGLEREVREEIGAQVTIESPITTLENWFYLKDKQTFHHTLRFYYHAELIGNIGTPTDKKVTEIKWFDWSDIGGTHFQDDVRYMRNYLPK